MTIASFKMKPVYEAAARVEVDKESQLNMQFPDDQNAYDEYVDMDTYLETQTKILQSETLAMQTDQIAGSGEVPGIRRDVRN